MTPLRRYDCVWGIQVGKVEGKIKTEEVEIKEEAVDNDTDSTEEMTALDSDKDGDLSDDETKEENRPLRGPRTILYGGNGTSTRALADKEDTALERTGAAAEGR